ncbi:MAG: hypothetical protein P8Z30_18045 [Acidobacteriota bacterium]
MMRRLWFSGVAILLMAVCSAAAEPQPYKNFKVTVYIPVSIVERMAHNPAWLQSSWKTISNRLHVDKVFIETYRSGVSADDATVSQVKHFFQSHGVEVAGGIALAGPGGSGQFRSLDYADPKDRALVSRMSALTARHFNEIILDDFFFTNTKSAADIAAKGKRTWDQFRLQQMDEVARDLILKPALAANPKVHIIIKYPNWYPSFQGLGYDLDRESKIFPEIWTGDETRDPVMTDQQLQQYESYEIFRYFENVAPGRNGGGWVDPYGVNYLDRYAEQLWDTILAKAPAINLFEYADLLRPAEAGDRGPWQMLPTSFNYFRMMFKCCGMPGSSGAKIPLLADAAAYSLRQVDKVAGELGTPLGLNSYRPYQSSGEDFLRDVVGMIGIPVEMYPDWPKAKTVLLTETAKYDPNIVTKIEQRLRDGDNVIITSGLLRAIQNEGMDQITDMRVTRNVLAANSYVAGFGAGAGTEVGGTQRSILFPEVHFYTNEDWAVVRGLADGHGVPLLLMDRYGKGTLYVWTVPENMNDLYRLPASVLNSLRRYFDVGLPVKMNGPAKVSLFEYNNGTFVVESFLDHPSTVRITGSFSQIQNVMTGTALSGDPIPVPGAMFRPRSSGNHVPRNYGYELRIEPHSFVAFREKP